MELKIIFPYLVIFSVFVRVQCIDNNIINIKHQESSLQDEECFCIPGNLQGERVSKYVSLGGENLDRLIVYLYRDRNKKITVYVPGKEKQKALPDLTYDDGDIVDQFDEKNVNRLFGSYSEVIPQNKDDQVQDKRRDDLPYNIINIDNTQDISDVVPENQGNNLNGYMIGSVRPSKTKQIYSDVASPISISNFINFPEDVSVSSDTNIIKPGNVPHVVQYDPLSPEDVMVSQHESRRDEKIEVSQSTPKLTFNLPIENKHPDDNNLFGDLTTIENHNAPEILNDEPIDLSTDAQKLSIETQSVLNEPRPVIVQVPRQYSNVKIIPVNHVTVATKPSSGSSISLSLPFNQRPSNQVTNIPNSIHPKFKKWFLEQLRLVQIRRPSIRYLISVRKLENVLIRTLYSNGMIITDSGDLREANGNVVKITDIRLRPIILGDPVQNEKVVANDCQAANNVRYFEAVLVTVVYPPKILGIIPLRKINKPCCNKWPCYKPNMNSQTIVINRNIKPEKEANKRLVISSRPKGNSLLGSFLNSRRMNKDSGSTLPNGEDILVPKVDTLELPEDEVVENFKDISEAETLEKEAPVEDLLTDKDTIEKEDYDVDDSGDDDLGIRIVGGTPATSSGTPVSVRGRRGIIKE